ncbi:hypothetical protein JDW21_18750 [Bacillus subtilis]|uniref:Uncharacterized protein n=1 Tax=Bacillus phage vB_BsuS_PJN02 TaxID=2920374 RepID=A0AC61TT59_9CAUD|nr:hypothetical protein [Bacillus subtilis]YP_010681621.1 hypothetical protein PQE76_gp003 [Bacillus phage vB_BsuS_PJN02]UNH58346.1 hypothetical protein [Bacillus phage vB_BsuS_PJN02]WOF32872.1 hypothetical protein OEJ84_23525 [Bacillus subtilis]
MSVEREVVGVSYIVKFKDGKYLEGVEESLGNTVIAFCTNKHRAKRIANKDDVKFALDVLERNGFKDVYILRNKIVREETIELIDLEDVV